jgi:hypothetical protein
MNANPVTWLLFDNLPIEARRIGNAGRGGRTRTGDLLVPNQARYRLRYAPRLPGPARNASAPKVCGSNSYSDGA